MEQNENSVSPEAATDEPASPLDPKSAGPEPWGATPEDQAYWQGVRHGLECLGAARRPDHKPEGWNRDLSRDGAAEPLTREGLAEAYRPVEKDSIGRSIRTDGFTPDRQRLFLTVLAACGVVADACRAAGISRDTAYRLRSSAEGAAFAVAWNAAVLIARGAVADELMSRAMNGVVERIYRNGELWGERHRHDNRLAMALLSRLDRQAEGLGEGAVSARLAAREWDQFLDLVEAGTGADSFLHKRSRDQVVEPPMSDGRTAPACSDAAMLSRLDQYRGLGVGLPGEIDISDLDPEEMESWTEHQWDRARRHGLLRRMERREWPEVARKVTKSGTNGTCPNRQDIPTGPERVRAEYVLRFPDAGGDPTEPNPAWVWEDEELGLWVTSYPPPEGFEGSEQGRWGDYRYQRMLSAREQEAVDAYLAGEQSADEADRAEARAAAAIARDRAFGFAPRGDASTAGTTASDPPLKGEGDHA